MVDETGRIPADSIWINTVLPDGRSKSISRFLETVAFDSNAMDSMNDDGEDSFDSLDEGNQGKGDQDCAATRKAAIVKIAPTVVEEEEEEEDGDEDESDSESYPHSVQIRIVKAEGLLAKDLGGTSDPFARLEVDMKKSSSFVTRTIPKTVDPLWDESFDVACNQESSQILICKCGVRKVGAVIVLE